MTCHQIQSLIDDYLDGELSEATRHKIEDHLRECPACAQEFDLASRVSDLLPEIQVPDPDSQYFEETRNIIIARTVESDPEQPGISPINIRTVKERSSFIRSLISVAASIGIFLTALSVGSHKETLSAVTANRDTQTASIISMVASPLEIPISIEEQEKIIGGTLMLGAPGLIGRFADFPYIMGTSQ